MTASRYDLALTDRPDVSGWAWMMAGAHKLSPHGALVLVALARDAEVRLASSGYTGSTPDGIAALLGNTLAPSTVRGWCSALHRAGLLERRTYRSTRGAYWRLPETALCWPQAPSS